MATRHNILEIIENHKDKIGDGDYLKLCNMLMKLEISKQVEYNEDLERKIRIYASIISTQEIHIRRLKDEIEFFKNKLDLYKNHETEKKIEELDIIKERIKNMNLYVKGCGLGLSKNIEAYLIDGEITKRPKK